MEYNFDCEVTLDLGSKTGTQMTQAEKNCDRRIRSIENKPFLKYVTLHPAVQLKSMFQVGTKMARIEVKRDI
jgi:hypothetical protein